MSMQRGLAWLVGTFASTALVLSCVGLYGLVAYSVGQRAREVAVRMALGAGRRAVYQLVIGQTAARASIGAALGIVCAVGAATLMRRLLFGVTAWDPWTLVAAVATVLASALIASYIPARRAASVDPTTVLRAE
jgi:macrolide transport system ATP-binding/permease protein